jgi:hypothetical protein
LGLTLVLIATPAAQAKERRVLLVGEYNGVPGQFTSIQAAVDATRPLLSKRVYKEAWQMDEVLAEIRRESGTHFDPELVAAFLRLAPHLNSELSASFAREKSSATPRPVAA